MYEDDTSAEDQEQVEAMSNVAAQGGGALDFAQLSDPTKVPGLLQAIYQRQLRAVDKQEAGNKARFDAGTALIKERYRGPTQSEQLFMLSKALLAPRDYRGFGGTVGKISGAFSDISDVERKAREQRNAQLAALQNQYMEKSDTFDVDRAKAAADVFKVAVPLLKAPTIRSALNSRDEVVNLNTAEIINAPPPPVGTIKTGRDGRKYRFTNITRDNDQYNKANWQEVK